MPPTAPGLVNIPVPQRAQPPAKLPLATQAPVCPLPGCGVRVQSPALAPPASAQGSHPAGSSLHCPPIVCSRKTANPGRRSRLGCSVWPPFLLPGAHLYAEGIRQIYCGLPLGSCLRPRNTLGRQLAVGKIRTGPSAATHALVTLQAASVEIIFIYNLFDHPASKRARLV